MPFVLLHIFLPLPPFLHLRFYSALSRSFHLIFLPDIFFLSSNSSLAKRPYSYDSYSALVSTIFFQSFYILFFFQFIGEVAPPTPTFRSLFSCLIITTFKMLFLTLVHHTHTISIYFFSFTLIFCNILLYFWYVFFY